jgi:AcrR family transcriptional regulator
MPKTKKRLSPEQSRLAALVEARALLIETGPQAVTLKAVASRVGRTHANLLHHFGFDAFDREGAGALASWMLLSGNEDALDPIVDAIHALVDDLAQDEAHDQHLREDTLALVIMALGDALMGERLSSSLGLARHSARQLAEQRLEQSLSEWHHVGEKCCDTPALAASGSKS